MEPNKFETQIREKLNVRAMQPSAQAWDKLDAMLSEHENKKPKRNFKWLYMAASIIGFVFVGLYLFNEEKATINNKSTHQTVVNSTDENFNQSQNTIVNKEASVAATIPEVKSSIKKRTAISEKVNQSKIAVSEKNSSKKTSIVKDEIKQLLTSEEPQKGTELAVNQSEKEKNIENKTNSDQIALVSSNNENRAIENVKPSKKETIKIDPKTLLSEVDGEIRLSFRQKVMKEVVQKFPIVKEALVNRNQQ
jgi:acetyl/propionyl-CoA carboxylase alpha subunit